MMEARRWIQPSVNGEMQFSMRASSKERVWGGVEAATYDVSAGIAERGPAAAYILILHLSAPVNGSCRCGGPTQTRVMGPGDMDFVPVGFDATWLDRAPGSVLNVRLNPSFVMSTAEAMHARNNGGVGMAPRLHLADRRLEHLARAIVDELEGDEPDRLFAESVSTSMASYLLRRYGSAPSSTASGGLSTRVLHDVFEYIDDNLAASFGLADLAAVARVSQSHFKTLFKRSTGLPVHQYVVRQRVDLAVRLITRGRSRLCEVAQEAGFAHQSHMARCMRRILGVTPAAVAHQSR